MAFTWARELDEYPTGAKRRKYLAMAVLASLICSYEAAIAPVVPLLLEDLQMELTTYGLIAAVSLLAGACAGLISGPLSDRIGRVRILIPLMAFTAFLAFTMVFVTSPTSLAIVRFILAFVDGLAVAVTAPLVRDFSPRMGRAQAMGFWAWGPVGANFISAGIAAATLPLFNNAWQSQFIIIGILSLIASIVIALNIADLSPRLRAEVLQTEKKVIEDASDDTPAKASTLLKSPVVWAHTVGISFWLLLYLTVTAFGQTMIVQTFGKTAAEASFIMSMFWVLNVFALVLTGRVSDRLQLRRIFTLVCTVISLVLVVIFAFMMGNPDTSTAVLAITGALIGGTMGAAYSPWMALYSENSEDIDPRLQGVTWGLFSFMTRFVAMLVVIVAPFVVRADDGSWQTWIIVCAVCMALFLVVMLFFKGPWTRRQLTAAAEAAVDAEVAPPAASRAER